MNPKHSETKPNQENCKNCSSKCAYECAQRQYTIQHRTILIISPLTSRQTFIAQMLSIGGGGETNSTKTLYEKQRHKPHRLTEIELCTMRFSTFYCNHSDATNH